MVPAATGAVPFAIELSGGAFIFLAFLVVAFLAIAFAYFSDAGTDIRFRAWTSSEGGAPGAQGFGNAAGKDPSQDVRNWSRGTGARRRQKNVPVTRTAVALEGRTDDDLVEQLGIWRARMNSASTGLAVPPDPARDHTIGPHDAPIVLTQYTDFECPSCQAAHKVVTKLRERLGDRMLFVLRHFPIADAHLNSLEGAEAVEAAGAQGRFWEMHDRIYSTRRPPNPEDLRKHARKLGLDMERFEREMSEHTHAHRVRDDFSTGLKSGVNGTPTFYIGTARYDGEAEVDEMLVALEAADARTPAAA